MKEKKKSRPVNVNMAGVDQNRSPVRFMGGPSRPRHASEHLVFAQLYNIGRPACNCLPMQMQKKKKRSWP